MASIYSHYSHYFITRMGYANIANKYSNYMQYSYYLNYLYFANNASQILGIFCINANNLSQIVGLCEYLSRVEANKYSRGLAMRVYASNSKYLNILNIISIFKHAYTILRQCYKRSYHRSYYPFEERMFLNQI